MIKRFEDFIKESVSSDKELEEYNKILFEITFRGNDAYEDEKYRFPVMTDELINPEATMKIGENGKYDICVSFRIVQLNTPVDFDDNGSADNFPADSLNPIQNNFLKRNGLDIDFSEMTMTIVNGYNFLMGLYNWLVKEKELSNVEYDDDSDSVIIHIEYNPDDGVDFEKFVEDVVIDYETMGIEYFDSILKRVFDWGFFKTYKKTS